MVNCGQNLNIQFGSSYFHTFQIGLHNLFHRLYAMYPNNFLHFLNQRYSGYDQRPIFNKTINPLLESVKMHPLLVITSKEKEISSARYKRNDYNFFNKQVYFCIGV